MTIIQAIFLGLIQGLTEFIPVSSSGHLVLAHNALGIQQSGLIFDVALHIGTLLALLVLFYKDIINLIKGLFTNDKLGKLARFLIIATIPAVIVGYLFETAAETTFRSTELVSITLIAMALVMLFAEKYSKDRQNKQNLDNMNKKQAIGIGVAQSLAIIPGISRSGVTITTGLFAGLDRVSATRFSFLLAIPVTFGAIVKVFLSSENLHQITHEQSIFAVGIITAFISGIFAIKFMIKYLSKHTLNIFAYYRIVVGVGALILTLVINK